MKQFILFVLLASVSAIFLSHLMAQAQSVTVTTVAAAPAAAIVPAVVSNPLSGIGTKGLIAIIASLVLCLNIVLSAIQQIFSQLAKQEPGWLQSVSKVVLSVSKWLGSNPNV